MCNDSLSKQFLFSPLETISTSVWTSLHIVQYCLFSVVSAVTQFVSAHIFQVVVDPSPTPSLGRSHHLFPGTTMRIIFLETLSSSLHASPDMFIPFSIYALASSCMIWCYSLSIVASSFLIHAI